MRQPSGARNRDSWLPKSILCLRTYNVRTFLADLVAGVTVGLVALPLAMAFAISSGLSPQAGIYTAIVAGFLASLLGGSKTQVSGPTGAFVVVVAGIVAVHGADGLYTVTLMAGVILILLGATGLGTAVKYIPRPVVVGFTNGIAVLIASTQLKDFFGLTPPHVPGEFLPRMMTLWDYRATFSPATAGLALVSLAALIVMVRYVKKVPGTIVVLIGVTAVATLLKLPVETIFTRFHGIPQGLPSVHVPALRPDLVSKLISPALTVAMLGAIESLMSAVVADRMTKDKHNPNVELIAQGVANVFSPLFGGLPATGAIARTATNIRAGAKSPVSGIIHALTLLVVLLVAAPLANKIPLAVLSAILLMVAYNMGEWKEIPHIIRLSRADAAVWAVSFFLTVFADLTVAVEVGMILAALLYISRVTQTTSVVEVTDEYIEEGKEHALQFHEVPNGVRIYRINGPFLFGSTDKIKEITDDIDSLPPIVVVRLRNMTAIDGTGVQALQDLALQLIEADRSVIFCGMRPQPDRLIRKSPIAHMLGDANLCESAAHAMARAREILDAQAEAIPSL